MKYSQQFPFTPEGCKEARNFLSDKGWTQQELDRISGFEIVHAANSYKKKEWVVKNNTLYFLTRIENRMN